MAKNIAVAIIVTFQNNSTLGHVLGMFTPNPAFESDAAKKPPRRSTLR